MRQMTPGVRGKEQLTEKTKGWLTQTSVCVWVGTDTRLYKGKQVDIIGELKGRQAGKTKRGGRETQRGHKQRKLSMTSRL